MAGKLAVTTVVTVPYGVDAGGESFLTLGPDDTVPDWAVALLGDHCWEGGTAPAAKRAKNAEPPADGDSPFDPADHNVVEVNEYLEQADEDERTRVLAAEAEGKARAGIVAGPHAEPPAGGDSDD